jgi:hypothetical protein
MEAYVGERYQRLNQRSYAKIIARSLRKSAKKGLRVIELGADRGFLLHYLNHFLPGRLAAVDAVEPNADVAMELSDELARIGPNCRIVSSLEDSVQGSSEAIDLLVGIHVFDHLFALTDLFDFVVPRLSGQGSIFFVVHNPLSLLARVMGRSWPAYSAQHPQLLTAAGVARLAQRYGMNIVQSGRTQNYFPMSMVTGYLGVSIPATQWTPVLAPLGNRYYLLKRCGP